MGRALIVAPPTFDPANYGLLSVVQARYDETQPYWQNGIRYEAICGLGATVFDNCITPNAEAVTEVTKAATVSKDWFEHAPVTVYQEFDCSPVGYTEEQLRGFATDALARSEEWQLEAAIWSGQRRTGSNGQGPGDLLPRLASNEELTLSNQLGPTITIQSAATVVGTPPVSGAALDLVEAMQLMEAQFYACYGKGLGTYHIPASLGLMGWRSNAFKADGPILRTQNGHKVALGGGYTGFGPGSALSGGASPPANTAWIYMTGPVVAYRSAVNVLGTFSQSFNRSSNTIQYIAERTWTLGWMGCCHLAALVSTGGIVTGQPLSPF